VKQKVGSSKILTRSTNPQPTRNKGGGKGHKLLTIKMKKGT
jgi:hypothetical protein